MKNLIIVAVFLLGTNFLTAQEEPASASEIMSEAYAEAAKENKRVFIMFHASWCGWCRKMDAKMNALELKAYFADNFVIKHLVIMEQDEKEKLENPGGEEFFKKYTKGKPTGIPFWLIFNAKGELLEDSFNANNADINIGCPQADHEVAEFIRILKSTTDLDEVALAKIAKKFSAE